VASAGSIETIGACGEQCAQRSTTIAIASMSAGNPGDDAREVD
jgi:hypothetical protein